MKRWLPILIILTVMVAAIARPGSSPRKTKRDSSPEARAIISELSDSIPSESPAITPFSDSTPSDSTTLHSPRPGAPLENDSAALTNTFDSLNAGKVRLNHLNKNQSNSDLSGPVKFSAKDSLILVGQNNAFLYGDGNVEYQEFKLNSALIQMDMDSATVAATGVRDSIGELTGNPIFSEKGTTYESETMKYNFKSERGYITNIITEQGEGFLTGGITKKNADGSFFLQDGRYTTCDNHEHPHFYFQITKGKMRPKKDVVTGPAYMVLADVPLPLALPFGYFPFSKDYSSGIIFPSFGDDYNRGFYLRDGGYYFAINDNVDLALKGEIYTKGSWGLSAHSTYVKRYKFRGSFDISYITTINGDKGMPDYSKQNNFQVIWSHSMDTKANPNLNFSASVNFTTSGYTRNDLNSYYNSSFTENTKSSTVNLTYRFPGTKWSLSTNASLSQRTQDSTLSVSFPNLTVTLAQTAPFKRKRASGGEKWYEKIRLSYTGQFQNSLTAKQNVFFKKSLIKDWRNGIKHYIPVSATFSLFKYINISPSITINDRMYTSKIRRQWDPNINAEVCDTTYSFYNVFDFNASLSLDTKLYGFYKPMKFLGDKVQMIRHVLTPTISISGAPDFAAPGWGIYDRYSYTDAQGNKQTRQYSYFSHGLFGVPGAGKSGIISVNLANNLEMKVKSDKDSTGYKKISLIENFSIGQSYNFAADSMNWSNLNTSIMLRLVKNFNLNLSASWDPYTYRLSPSGSPVRVNVPRWKAHKGWVRLASTGTSFSYTFSNATFRRNKDDKSSKTQDPYDPDNGDISEEEAFTGDGGDQDFKQRVAMRRANARKKNMEADADGYEKWECPWSLTLNYSVNYGYGEFDYDKLEYKGKLTQNLSISGNIRPTKNWNFSLSASYNFDLKKIAYMNCTITRDLHCFSMSASFVPVGPYKSYNFHISVNASMLKDLKYDKRSSSSNGIKWY